MSAIHETTTCSDQQSDGCTTASKRAQHTKTDEPVRDSEVRPTTLVLPKRLKDSKPSACSRRSKIYLRHISSETSPARAAAWCANAEQSGTVDTKKFFSQKGRAFTLLGASPDVWSEA